MSLQQLKFPLRHNYQGMIGNYVPRPHLEKEIVAGLKKQEGPGLITFPLVVLHGIGGVGKTTLARKMCQLTTGFFRTPHFGKSCIWIHAEKEELIIDEFARLLGIEEKTKIKIQEALRTCYQSQFEGNQCLFVFDNVDNYKTVADYLPLNLQTQISVLITSNTKWPLT